jgi:hypothetical protein
VKKRVVAVSRGRVVELIQHGPPFITAADLNGDGALDLIAADQFLTVSILLQVPPGGSRPGVPLNSQ